LVKKRPVNKLKATVRQITLIKLAWDISLTSIVKSS